MTIATSSLLSGSILDEQIRLEEKAVADGVARYIRLANEATKRGDGAALKPAERLLLHWFNSVADSIAKDVRKIRRGKAGQGVGIYGPVMMECDAERMALIALHEIIGATMKRPEGVNVSGLSVAIGRAVVAEIHLDMMKAKDMETRQTRRDRIDAGEDRRTVYEEEREEVKYLDNRFRQLSPVRVNWWSRKTLADKTWSSRVYAHVGARLIWHVIDCATLKDENGEEFAAYTRKQYGMGKDRAAKVVPDWRTLKIIDEGHEARQHLRPRYLPMIVPPYPWSKHTEGGYVRIRTPFVSKPTAEQKRALEAANLDTVYKALSAIGGTPWRINQKVREVQRAMYMSGGGDMRIPHKSNVPHPEHPRGYVREAPPNERWASVPKDEKKAYKVAAAKSIKENLGRTAAREDYLTKHRVAEMFLDHEAIYFPHQLCFRGRGYSIPVPLNIQGDDVCRGLLEFSEAKPVSDVDVYWIKVQAATMYGIDDVGFDDRARWADAHMPQILRAAADPFSDDWWTHADEKRAGTRDGKPWQFLAACFALADHEHCGSRLPVQCDGTANGLQHFTALGRDEVAAPSLNMVEADAPVSPYIIVGDATDDIVRRDALTMPTARAILDVVGKIGKPIAKPPTMTSSYGVTPIGARRQVSKALAEAGYEGNLFEASVYLAERVNQGIGRVCQSAMKIMEWIRTCAGLIARKGRLVTWTSPLGFPVVQPYRNWGTSRVETILQDIYLIEETEDARVAVGDQIDAVAANYIHSIDAAHMMMTAIECERVGVTAGFVHDNDWTHAETRPQLDRILREQFVALHSRDLLGELITEWRNIHPDIDFPDPPERGTFDIRKVLKATYLFH